MTKFEKLLADKLTKFRPPVFKLLAYFAKEKFLRRKDKVVKPITELCRDIKISTVEFYKALLILEEEELIEVIKEMLPGNKNPVNVYYLKF